MVNTRSKSYGHTIEEQNHASLAETLTERRVRWSNLLRQQHYQPLISEILEEELLKYPNSTMSNGAERSLLVRECALILASASLVFQAAAYGTLVKQILADPTLQEDHALIQDRAQSSPSIYLHQLADEHGVAPNPTQYMIIRDLIIDYLSEGQSSEHAWQIDNTTPPTVSPVASSLGHRKYLHTTTRSAARVSTLRRFCAGIERLFLETPIDLRKTPMRFPPGECGYSKSSHIRLAQHRAHQSSNYVMNLVEDICTYLHTTKRFKQRFRMHQFIIYLIFRPEQAAIAEIFCSGLLQVWVDNGGGFNAYPAGRSVATAKRVSSHEWEMHERWVRQMSPIEENMRAQKARADEWVKALEWEGEKEKMEEAIEEEDVSRLTYDCG
ncbi:hypothetical protein DE146DRAFT_198165 [Phaeosphaeria sp. MPI-PUGE-AT-0046c]|nr:hypothetical protein DE146DRAFT_198165 [Phaeosphaeria sp. MPI-PUGE-AT-0046c]